MKRTIRGKIPVRLILVIALAALVLAATMPAAFAKSQFPAAANIVMNNWGYKEDSPNSPVLQGHPENGTNDQRLCQGNQVKLEQQ